MPEGGSTVHRGSANSASVNAALGKPEASYFAADLGMRTSFFVFDMTASHQLPEIAEAFFAIGGEVEVMPCMTPDDLQKGLAAAGL